MYEETNNLTKSTNFCNQSLSTFFKQCQFMTCIKLEHQRSKDMIPINQNLLEQGQALPIHFRQICVQFFYLLYSCRYRMLVPVPADQFLCFQKKQNIIVLILNKFVQFNQSKISEIIDLPYFQLYINFISIIANQWEKCQSQNPVRKDKMTFNNFKECIQNVCKQCKTNDQLAFKYLQKSKIFRQCSVLFSISECSLLLQIKKNQQLINNFRKARIIEKKLTQTYCELANQKEKKQSLLDISKIIEKNIKEYFQSFQIKPFYYNPQQRHKDNYEKNSSILKIGLKIYKNQQDLQNEIKMQSQDQKFLEYQIQYCWCRNSLSILMLTDIMFEPFDADSVILKWNELTFQSYGLNLQITNKSSSSKSLAIRAKSFFNHKQPTISSIIIMIELVIATYKIVSMDLLQQKNLSKLAMLWTLFLYCKNQLYKMLLRMDETMKILQRLLKNRYTANFSIFKKLMFISIQTLNIYPQRYIYHHLKEESMLNEKFERIVQGKHEELNYQQLTEFQVYCSSLSLKLERWIEISNNIFLTNEQNCQHFLLFLEKNEINRTCYNDYTHQGPKIQIYNNLAAIILAKAIKQTSQEQIDKYINQARKFLNLSEKVKMTVQRSIIITRAFFLYYSGDLQKSANFFNKAHDQSFITNKQAQLSVLGYLGLAQINFVRQNYSKALELYKQALQTNKNLPSKARIGMSYCFYFLGKYELAKISFERVLSLNPNCIQACIGLAVICDKQQNTIGYFQWIQKAFKLDKKHPLTLLHIAEHFLLSGQLQKAQKYSLDGLKQIGKINQFLKTQQNIKNDQIQAKARFHNILAQVHHIKNNQTDSLSNYTAGQEKDSIYIFNDIGLTQVLTNPNSQNYIEALKILQNLFRKSHQTGKDTRLINEGIRLIAYLKSKIPSNKNDELKAEQYYQQALKYNKEDYEVQIEFANLLTQRNPKKALKLMINAQQLQKQVRVELLNNIAVLQLQTNNYQQACSKLQQCIRLLQQAKKTSQEQNLQKTALELNVTFNLAFVYENLFQFQKASELYEKIIKQNKYYVDAYIRFAGIKYHMGYYEQALEILKNSYQICEQSKALFLRPEKIVNFQAHLMYLEGSISDARQLLRKLGKNRDIYTQFYELGITYESIMHKPVQMPVLKSFLRPQRQFCMRHCQGDPQNAFAYLALIVILLTDQKINKNQAVQFFGLLKQYCDDKIPSILWNMGLFSLNYEQYAGCLSLLMAYKQKNISLKDNIRAEEMIALAYLLKKNHQNSLSHIKKCILKDPTNLKYRYQLVYVSEKLIQKNHQQKQVNQQSQNTFQTLQKCLVFYNYFSRISINDHIRTIQVPEMKQKLRNLYTKLKSSSEERKLYVRSNIEFYEKLQEQIEQKQRAERQWEERNLEQLRNARLKTDQIFQKVFGDSDDSQEQRERKQKEQKRKKVLEIARIKQEQMNKAWSNMQEQEKQKADDKKIKKGRKPIQKRKGEKISKFQSSESSLDYKEEEKSYQSEDVIKLPKRVKKTSNIEDIKDRKKVKKTILSSQSSEISEKSHQKSQIEPENVALNEDQDQEDIDMKKYLA